MVRRAARVRRPSPLRCLVEVEKILGPQEEERERGGGGGILAMAKVVTPTFTGRTNLLAGRKDVGFPVGIGLVWFPARSRGRPSGVSQLLFETCGMMNKCNYRTF